MPQQNTKFVYTLDESKLVYSFILDPLIHQKSIVRSPKVQISRSLHPHPPAPPRRVPPRSVQVARTLKAHGRATGLSAGLSGRPVFLAWEEGDHEAKKGGAPQNGTSGLWLGIGRTEGGRVGDLCTTSSRSTQPVALPDIN